MRLNTYLTESTTNVIIKKPNQCTKEEKITFVDLVISGNQNREEHVLKTFRSLVYVGFLYENDEIMAVSSIKKGRTISFEKAGVPDEAENYPYEVGFSFTSPKSRGKGYNTILKKKMFSKIKGYGVYATIRIDNKASLSVNKKFGFTELGEPYQGIVTDVKLLVYDNK